MRHLWTNRFSTYINFSISVTDLFSHFYCEIYKFFLGASRVLVVIVKTQYTIFRLPRYLNGKLMLARVFIRRDC